MTERGYKRRRFIINPKLQFIIALFSAALSALTSIVYFSVIDSMFDNFHKVISKIGVSQSIYSTLENEFTQTITMLIFYQVFVCLALFTSCALFTHRIAGPIYRIKQVLASIRSGDTKNSKIVLRKGDYFHDLAKDINATIESISTQKGNNR